MCIIVNIIMYHILDHRNEEKFNVLPRRDGGSIRDRWFRMWIILVVIVIIIFIIFAVHELPLSKNDIMCYFKNDMKYFDVTQCVRESSDS